MERRLSVAVAAAGLLGAIGIFFLGRKTSSDDVVRSVGADLGALIRESAAGVKERADTLAQLPRISWAVATDEATVRDLTNEELAFRTHPGEHIEITQLHKGGGEPRRLLRLPADSDVSLPMMVGTHVVVRDDRLQLVTVVSVEPHEHADQVVGLLAVAKQLDTSTLEQRLAARRINAEVRTIQGSFVLAGSAPSAVDAKIALTGPAAAGTVLVAANLGAPRWPLVVAPLVLLLSLAGAALLWRRGFAPLAPAEVPFARGFDEPPSAQNAEGDDEQDPEQPTAPTAAPPAVAPPAPPPPLRPPLLARSTTPAPGTRPAKPTPVEAPAARQPTPPLGAKAAYPEARLPTPPLGAKAAYPEARLPTPARAAAKATPVAGLATVPEEAVPVAIEGVGRSGRIDTSLIRTGSVSLPPRGLGPPPPPPAAKPDADPRAEQYRNLFAEFVKLRKTTGESVADLDANHFVATLREKRAQIMKQIPVKDVQFKLAFHNGKAAIRYLTVT